MDVGQRIKKLRLENEMSQEELGNKIGVKRAAINKYENGTVVNLKRSTISKLADALNTTPTYLMGWEEEQEILDGTEEAKLVKKYSRLSKANKQAVLNLIDNLLEGQTGQSSL